MMKTYTNILDSMNAKVRKLEQSIQKLENNFTNTEDIIQYLMAHNEHHEVRELYHNFFEHCVRNDFDLDSEFNDITIKIKTLYDSNSKTGSKSIKKNTRQF